MALLGLIALGLAINAFLCGALVETADRHQSRVIWLLVLHGLIGALAVLEDWRASRRRSVVALPDAATAAVRRQHGD